MTVDLEPKLKKWTKYPFHEHSLHSEIWRIVSTWDVSGIHSEM